MIQLLDLSWWVSLADQIWPWWLACALLGVLAWPLTVRAFQGLADRGAGLAIGIGIILTTWLAWVMGHLGVPHGGLSIRIAGLLVAAASVGAWWRRPRRGLAALRATVAPFVASQLLFALGFTYFCNVRSYLPWITFDIGLSGAEKLGNLMHLNSVLRATSMPPRDAWLLGEPTNYYYGGHLLVATLAKLTGTPARFAFNLGLATIFALTLAMGFSLTYAMAVRRGPRLRRRRVPWHRGLAWGVLGGLAIAVFGNLDAWRQLGRRDPAGAQQQIEWRLRSELERTRDRDRAAAIRSEIARVAAIPPERMRWSAENLEQIDYWASSRAIRGAPPGADPATITEFPYFSAMLGDLHPHHMALPYTITALAACLALLRRNPTPRSRTEKDWWKRCGPAAAAMGFAIGAVFPVNIWDSIVLSVLYLLCLVISRRGVVPDPRWRHAAFAALLTASSWVTALLVNTHAKIPALGTPPLYALALVITVAGPLAIARWRPALAGVPRLQAAIAAGAAVAAVGGLVAGLSARNGTITDAALAALRDGLLLLSAAGFAAGLVRTGASGLSRVTATLGTYAVVGGIALAVAAPFLLNFHSPLEAQARLFDSKLPPVPAVPAGTEPLATRIWAASPINPFPAELRSEILDALAHWGLFALPLAGFAALALVLAARRGGTVAVAGIVAGTVALIAVTYRALDGYWTGPLALGLAMACALLAGRPRTRVDAPVFLFAAAGFFWCWFVEALHFDDSYGGVLERYNTPFKIFYPVWPMLAAATIGALRRLSPRIPARSWPLLALLRSPGVLMMAIVTGLVAVQTLGRPLGLRAAGVALAAALLLGTLAQLVALILRRSGRTDAPALSAAALMLVLGLLYPFAATANRTRSLFSEPIEGTWMEDPNGERVREFYTRRSLDGLAWLGQTRRFASDLPAIEWLIEHGPAGSVVLEAPSNGAYTPEGRVASMTGLPTLVGWKHHENQWRGWGKPMPLDLQRRLFDEFAEQLPPLALAEVPREVQIDLYRASLESRDALLARLRGVLPKADGHELDAAADGILAARQKTLSATALTEKLGERMKELLEAPTFDEAARQHLRLYGIRYVFAGTLEKQTFGTGLDKLRALRSVFEEGGTSVYEVPADWRGRAGPP
jgi:uncharacterized membrane protein